MLLKSISNIQKIDGPNLQFVILVSLPLARNRFKKRFFYCTLHLSISAWEL